MNNVEKALKREDARNNDLELILSVWELDGVELPPQTRKAILECATHPETITRTRRTLQANGKYLANKHVRKHRAERAQEARDSLGQSESLTQSENPRNPSFPKFGCRHCSIMQRNKNWRPHQHG